MPIMRNLRSSEVLVSWMDSHQARTEAMREEIVAQLDAHQGRMEACINAW
jgi:hypothetical protein